MLQLNLLGTRDLNSRPSIIEFDAQTKGVVRGGPGVLVIPLLQAFFDQTT